MKKNTILIHIMSLLIMAGCTGYDQSNKMSQLFYGLLFSDSPVLNSLTITGVANTQIDLAMPSLSSRGNPAPTVDAWIGLAGGATPITITGTTVSNSLQGPIDVSASPYSFTGLSPSTIYRIIVLAQNSNGYSVMQILQSTSYIAPVLNALAITLAPTTSSITLDPPSFANAGNPPAIAEAWIGLAGGATPVTVTPAGTGYTVANSIQGPIPVIPGGYNFVGLPFSNTIYRIYVVAQNQDVGGVFHQSIQFIDQATFGTPPTLAALGVITSPTPTSIQMTLPSFTINGNPITSPIGYIGVDTVIANPAGATITGYVQGPIVLGVAPGTYTFNGLNPGTPYRIYVTADNGIGTSVVNGGQSTGSSAPLLAGLGGISSPTPTSIQMNIPSFTTQGNPVTSAIGYIGVDTVIQNPAGVTITGYIQGPIVFGPGPGTYTFNGLNPGTSYRIYVTADNGIAPSSVVFSAATLTGSTLVVLDIVNVSATTANSITINLPTYAALPNPITQPIAYIGVAGIIANPAGTTITGYSQGPFVLNWAPGTYTFNALNPALSYQIYVTADNGVGNSTQLALATGFAPVMNALTLTPGAAFSGDITLSLPTFSTLGSPAPTRFAYFGRTFGATPISVNMATGAVSNALAGPVDVSVVGTTFTGITTFSYTVIVVAQNIAGLSIQSATQIAP